MAAPSPTAAAAPPRLFVPSRRSAFSAPSASTSSGRAEPPRLFVPSRRSAFSAPSVSTSSTRASSSDSWTRDKASRTCLAPPEPIKRTDGAKIAGRASLSQSWVADKIPSVGATPPPAARAGHAPAAPPTQVNTNPAPTVHPCLTLPALVDNPLAVGNCAASPVCLAPLTQLEKPLAVGTAPTAPAELAQPTQPLALDMAPIPTAKIASVPPRQVTKPLAVCSTSVTYATPASAPCNVSLGHSLKDTPLKVDAKPAFAPTTKFKSCVADTLLASPSVGAGNGSSSKRSASFSNVDSWDKRSRYIPDKRPRYYPSSCASYTYYSPEVVFYAGNAFLKAPEPELKVNIRFVQRINFVIYTDYYIMQNTAGMT